MKSKSRTDSDSVRRDFELDYSKAVWGKYYRRILKEGSNIVVLEPDIAKKFRSSAAVNDALRSLLKITDDVSRNFVSKPSSRK